MNITAAASIIRQLHNTHAPNKPKTQVTTGSARLHLIIQFPVLNISGRSDDDVTKRQTEYFYCLQRNLLSVHVSTRHIHLEIIEALFAVGMGLKEGAETCPHTSLRLQTYFCRGSKAYKNVYFSA